MLRISTSVAQVHVSIAVVSVTEMMIVETMKTKIKETVPVTFTRASG